METQQEALAPADVFFLGEPQKSDVELIEESKGGCETAFGALVRRYEFRVNRHCFRMIGDVEESADLAQEVFLKVFRKLEQYEPRHSFYTWLFRITTNRCIDHLRKRKSSRKRGEMGPLATQKDGMEFEIPDNTFNPEKKEMASQLGASLQRAIAKLPEALGAALVQREVEGRSYSEIANAMGCTKEAVKSRIFRAKGVLRRQLGAFSESLV